MGVVHVGIIGDYKKILFDFIACFYDLLFVILFLFFISSFS